MFNQSQSVWSALSALGVAASTVVAAPAQALQVAVQPTKPTLGDTVSVVIQADTNRQAPTVAFGGQTYPTFAIGENRWRSLLPTTPLEKPGRRSLKIVAGSETSNMAVWVANQTFPVQRIWLPPGKSTEGTALELNRVAAFKKLVTPKKLWSGPFLKPNSGPTTTGYGVRRYYNGEFAQDYYHRGVDYAGGSGSSVTAPAAGRVALVGQESQGFRLHGNVVGLDHGQGVTSIFLHLSRINVQEGELMQAGEVIGTVGSTGASTGPHLHWGLYVNGQSVDPLPWRAQGFE